MIENGAVSLLLLAAVLLVSDRQADRGNIDRRELAEYHLTTADFEQFRNASQRIAIVIAHDASFQAHPLFSREIVQSGDVTDASAALEARLRSDAGLSEALKAAKVKCRFHDLRHTAASYMAQQGRSLIEIADFLGHRQFAMTKRYSHLTVATKARLVLEVFGEVK